MIKEIKKLSTEDIAGICDHTFLDRVESYRSIVKPGESPVREWGKSFRWFLEDSAHFKYPPYAVCIRPENVWYAKSILKELKSGIKIASVVGFPNILGYTPEWQLNEAKLAIEDGANEIDFVFNYGPPWLGCIWSAIEEIEHISKITKEAGVLSKMILETSELDNERIIQACKLADKYELDFVKTSTGFSSAGAKAGHLEIMRSHFPRGVKMSGGVNPSNLNELLYAVSGRSDGRIDLDPRKVRIGESSLLTKLIDAKTNSSDY